MLKLFRRIRLSLLHEGRLKKYSAYVIGEILLIVIGILLALQINEWQQEHQAKETEKTLLQELEIDLTNNSDILTATIEWENEIIGDIEHILELFETQSPIEDSLINNMFRIGFLEELQLVHTTYETLKSMGLNIISSDSLRVAVAQLFEVEYPKEENWVNTIANTQLATFGYPIHLQHWTIKEGSQYPIDIDNLMTDPAYKSMLGMELGFKRAIIYRAAILYDKTERLQQSVREEIGRLN